MIDGMGFFVWMMMCGCWLVVEVMFDFQMYIDCCVFGQVVNDMVVVEDFDVVVDFDIGSGYNIWILFGQ